MAVEWLNTTVGNLIMSQGGEIRIGLFGVLLKADEYTDAGTPVVAAGDIGNGCLRLNGRTPRVPAEVVKRLEKFCVEPGDLLLGRKGKKAIGRSALIRESESGWLLGSDCIRLRLPKTVDPRFVSYQLRSPKHRDWLQQHAIGSTIPSLTRAVVSLMPLAVPPLPVQKAISRLLGALDHKIELNQRTSKRMESIGHAIFQSWFVDFSPVRAKIEGHDPDLPGSIAAIIPDAFEDSELGRIPRGWEVRPIREVTDALFDGPHATPPESSTGHVFLGIQNLTGTQIDLTDVRHISEEHWCRWTKRVTPEPGDIVFTYEGTLGHFALIPPDLRCCLGRRLALVRPKEREPFRHYLFHCFVSEPFQRMLIERSVHGSTVNRVSLRGFPNYLLLWPPARLRAIFDDFAESVWAMIHRNQKEARTLAAIRDALLPKLVSGELRLKEAEKLVRRSVLCR
jgi:type I restriction enzyme S subunit